MLVCDCFAVHSGRSGPIKTTGDDNRRRRVRALYYQLTAMQPRQLARARKVRRSDRPTVELLPFIRIDDLRPIARNNPHLRECVAPGWRYPHVARLRFSALAIEITTNNGNTESFRLHWISTGQGTQPRAVIICRCGRRTERLFYYRGRHACRWCHRAL
jgi:hypothetical protein